MLVVGAGGLAAQLFDDLVASNTQDVVFWSETETKFSFIKDRYKIISTDREVRDYFENISKSFIICVGDNQNRKNMASKFKELGGRVTTFITPFCDISPYGTSIGNGTVVLNKVNMESGVTIGEECLINKRSYYGHGSVIGSYCEIGPTAIISAESEIGENCLIGIGAIILPRVKVGNNVLVAAGAVVTKNIEDNAVVAGVPAKLRFLKK